LWSRPICSETSAGRFVGGRAAADFAAAIPVPARWCGLANSTRISPVNC
jgi:hypothetical protein